MVKSMGRWRLRTLGLFSKDGYLRLKFRDVLQSLAELFILIGYLLVEVFNTLLVDPLCFFVA
jgi:hypothetical protein